MAGAFRLEELDHQIGLITFDLPDQKVNTLSYAVLAELSELIDRLAARTDLRGLLFQSGKPGQYIAGADLKELGALAYASPEQVQAGLAGGHELFSRISRLPFPTVALIDGNCLGGGTELSLSMDYRLASAAPQTKIGLPEVQVGLIPGWGGTQRLPRLIGVNNAVEMICSGESVSAARAAALGLVFDAVPAAALVAEGVRLIEHVQATKSWPAHRQQQTEPVGLSGDAFQFLFATAEGYLRGKTKGQYPAPLAALRAIKEGCNLPLEEGLAAERRVALDVVGTPISANLIAMFFMNNRLARDPGVADRSIVPHGVGRVGVLGAGQMGAGIATAHARSGIFTAMVDVDNARLTDGLKRATDVVAGRMKIGRATTDDLAVMLGHLSSSTTTQMFGDCDVVIEAITENEAVKTETYRKLAGVLAEGAILASNTSTISITRMAAAAPHADKFIGMHFFYPVDRMALVEVIRGEQTSDATVATIVALAKKIRKTPIVVRDCAGFLVNRVLLPYMNEAVLLLLEGAELDEIDSAAVRFGMPVGPLALHDMVGLDTACYAGRVMLQAYADRTAPAPLLEELVKAGRLGQKSGAGFRKYSGKKGKPEADPAFVSILEKFRTGHRKFSGDELIERLFFPMLLEATRVIEENIVRDPADADMGLILGIGFPAFRGGILRWCDAEGAANLLNRLEPYAHLGRRFEPTETLRTHARTGQRFYPLGPPPPGASF